MGAFAGTPGAIAGFFENLPGPADQVYLRPVAPFAGTAAAEAVAAGRAWQLAGRSLAYSLCEVAARGRDGIRRVLVGAPELAAWSVEAPGPQARRIRRLLSVLETERPPFAGCALAAGRGGRTLIMGIVNVTPDSFSDGGLYLDPEAAVAHGLALRAAGADILDVGGESTRPGARPVPAEEELRRTIPVVRALAEAGALVSIDTRRAKVMAEAVAAGAKIINDVSALAHDPESLSVAAQSGASVILMHMQGEPATMQDDPAYEDAPLDVYDYLEARVAACAEAGIAPDRVAVDPGIGFGKTKRHNAEILRSLALYHGLGCAVTIGVSRKSFVAGASGGEPPSARLPGSLSAALAAVAQGVQILRVHDVAETRQALAVWDAVRDLA